MGLAFGELLRDAIPTLAWSVKVNDDGRDRALDYPGSGICTYPEAVLLKRFARAEEVNLQELATDLIQGFEDVFRRYANGG